MIRTRTNRYVMPMSLLLFLALSGAVVAVCLKNYIIGICAGAIALAYFAVMIAGIVRCDDGKTFFALSWAVMFIVVILLAATPVTLVLLLVELIVEKAHKQ